MNEINHNSISRDCWINKFAALTDWLAQGLHGFASCARADPIQTQKWSWPPPKVTFMESRKERWRNKEPARRGLWLRRRRPRGSDKGHLVMSGGDMRTWAVCPRAGEEGAHGGGASLRSALQGSLMDRWGVCVCGGWGLGVGGSQINSYTVQTSRDQRCLMSVTIAICGMDLFLLLGEICWRGANTHLSYFNLRDMAGKMSFNNSANGYQHKVILFSFQL